MKINNAVLIGIMAAFCVILGIVENFIPMPIPAIRLGLANVPIMVMLCISSTKNAFSILLLKSILVPLFSGNFIFKLSLGFPSSLMAFIGMVVVMQLFRGKVSSVSVSVTSACLHMFTQLTVANYLYINGLLGSSIVGILMLTASISGILTGLLTIKLVPILERLCKQASNEGVQLS